MTYIITFFCVAMFIGINVAEGIKKKAALSAKKKLKNKQIAAIKTTKPAEKVLSTTSASRQSATVANVVLTGSNFAQFGLKQEQLN